MDTIAVDNNIVIFIVDMNAQGPEGADRTERVLCSEEVFYDAFPF